MVVRRVKIESTAKGEETESASLLSKLVQEENNGKSKILVWIMVIMVILAGYHTFDSYNEQVRMEEEQKKEGLNCLYQFRTEDCNPLKLNHKCNQLLQCVQRTQTDVDQLQIITSTIKKTSKCLSETLVGPVALMVGVAVVSYFKKK